MTDTIANLVQAQLVSGAVRAYLGGIEEVSKFVNLDVFQPIAHDPEQPHFGDAVEYVKTGNRELRAFPGTKFRNKDGIYIAVVEGGEMHFRMLS